MPNDSMLPEKLPSPSKKIYHPRLLNTSLFMSQERGIFHNSIQAKQERPRKNFSLQPISSLRCFRSLSVARLRLDLAGRE